MKDQIASTVSSCYYSLRLLRKILPYLPYEHRRTLVQAIVMNRLDYGNALLAKVGETLLAKLQVLQNTAASMILIGPLVHHRLLC